MGRRLVTRREDAGAFQRDVDAQILPGKLARILDGGDLELVGADRDRVALHHHVMREPAMDGVELEEVGIGFHRS